VRRRIGRTVEPPVAEKGHTITTMCCIRIIDSADMLDNKRTHQIVGDPFLAFLISEMVEKGAQLL